MTQDVQDVQDAQGEQDVHDVQDVQVVQDVQDAHDEQSAQDVQKAQESGFSAALARLEEIARDVDSDDITLDRALELYEEAVKIGLSACDLSELDIPEEEVDTNVTADESDR